MYLCICIFISAYIDRIKHWVFDWRSPESFPLLILLLQITIWNWESICWRYVGSTLESSISNDGVIFRQFWNVWLAFLSFFGKLSSSLGIQQSRYTRIGCISMKSYWDFPWALGAPSGLMKIVSSSILLYSFILLEDLSGTGCF